MSVIARGGRAWPGRRVGGAFAALAFAGVIIATPSRAQPLDWVQASGEWTTFATYQPQGERPGVASFGSKLTLRGLVPLGAESGWTLNLALEAAGGRALVEENSFILAPSNTALVTPDYGETAADLTASATKAFANGATLTFGKINVIDASAKTPLVGGGGREGFQHLQLATPMTIYTPPVILGALAAVPLGPVIATAGLYHPDNAVGRGWPAGGSGVSGLVGATLPVRPGGLPGFQTLKVLWTTRDQIDFGDTDVILSPDAQIGATDGGAALQYTFQQYLHVNPARPGAGWGLFGQTMLWEHNASPVEWSASLGLTGTSLIASRPEDRFGVGAFVLSINDTLIRGLSPLVDLGTERGVEAFYTWAVREDVRLTATLQVIDPAPRSEATLLTLGLRARLTF